MVQTGYETPYSRLCIQEKPDCGCRILQDAGPWHDPGLRIKGFLPMCGLVGYVCSGEAGCSGTADGPTIRLHNHSGYFEERVPESRL